MQKGQSSLELLFVLSIIIIVSFLVLGKFFSSSDTIFVNATARAVMVAELAADKNYLSKVESKICPTEVRVNFTIYPGPLDPSGSLDPKFRWGGRIDNEVTKAIRDSTAFKVKPIKVCYNKPAYLDCAVAFNSCP